MYPTKFSTPLTGLDWLEYYASHRVYHPGVDFNYGSGWDDHGQEIVASKPGKVIYVQNSEKWNDHRGFGKFFILKHDDGMYTRCAHNQKNEPLAIGSHVKEGQKIANLGNTGTSSPHLHFEVFNEGMAEIQRNHRVYGYLRRPWCFYPGSKTKQWIQDYYVNPWEWLRKSTESHEFKQAFNEMKEDGVYSEHTKKYDEVNTSTLAVFLKRLKDIYK